MCPKERSRRKQPRERTRRGKSHARPAAADAVARPTRAVVFVFLGALTVRLLYLLSIHNAAFFHHLQTEPLHYHEWASVILEGHAPSPPFEQSPGYPYFVAAVYALFAPSSTVVASVQALLDAATEKCEKTLVSSCHVGWIDRSTVGNDPALLVGSVCGDGFRVSPAPRNMLWCTATRRPDAVG